MSEFTPTQRVSLSRPLYGLAAGERGTVREAKPDGTYIVMLDAVAGVGVTETNSVYMNVVEWGEILVFGDVLQAIYDKSN